MVQNLRHIGNNGNVFATCALKFCVSKNVRPGWDKTFYFVGADAFRQKFRPKQRESDATKNFENSGNLTLNKWNLLYESLYESLNVCFFPLFKQSFPLDKSIFFIFN